MIRTYTAFIATIVAILALLGVYHWGYSNGVAKGKAKLEKYVAKAEAKTEAKVEAQKEVITQVVEKVVEKEVFVDRYVPKLVKEIEYVAASIPDCAIPAPAVRVLNDARTCALYPAASTCQADSEVRHP